MALGTYFDVHVLALGRACLELVAATAGYGDFRIVWMNFGLHAVSLSKRVAGNAQLSGKLAN